MDQKLFFFKPEVNSENLEDIYIKPLATLCKHVELVFLYIIYIKSKTYTINKT